VPTSEKNVSEDSNLKDQTALVTGASRRIGAEIVRHLHSAGARVAIHYRSSENDARRLCDDLNGQRENSARTFAADLLEHDAPQALVDAVVSWSGSLNILVNNASSFYPTPIGSITETQWDDLVGSNLKVPLFLSQSATPHLTRSGGVIINIVDIHARRPLKDHVVYGPAKAGLEMLTRSLAKDLAPAVRVNGVAPGAILWPETGMTETVQNNILEQIPLGRAGSPGDIAECVVYLARDARYVTGQVIAVDGGRSLGW
jgi:pteridine reductase